MKVVACCKVVPNEELIKVLPDRSLDFSEATTEIGQYDLNALECGKQLIQGNQGTMTALTLGKSAYLDPTKIQKDILSRGATDLAMIVDDNLEYVDSLSTAKALKKGVTEIGDVDIVLCGTGSSDSYSQVVGVQLGELLGWANVNNVSSVKFNGTELEVERTLESSAEVFTVPLPCVLSLSSEINIPAVPSMRDIMGAGKKPVARLTPDLSDIKESIKVVSDLAPLAQDRRKEIVEGDDEKAVDQLISFLKKEVL